MRFLSLQKTLFNRLRLHIDLFMLSNIDRKTANPPNRKHITDCVTNEISRYSKACGSEVRPISVQPRLTEEELFAEFFIKHMSENAKHSYDPMKEESDDGFNEVLTCEEMIEENGYDMSSMNGEVMEVLVSPDDISASSPIPYQLQHHPHVSAKQESLLKPKAERLSFPKEETTKKPENAQCSNSKNPPQQQQPISISRLRLKEALNKAKDEKHTKAAQPYPVAILKAKRGSPSTDMIIGPANVKTLSISSKSRSSTSSEDTFEYPELPQEDEEPTVLIKEQFLRIFGLYTHSYSQFLKSRRTERRRRNCTSTERGDFHYGRLDMFEKQYAGKRSNRQFLYSPPATRAGAKRRRVFPTNAVQNTKGKPVAKSSSDSSVNNDEKVCMKCFKKRKFDRLNDILMIRILFYTIIF